MGFLPACLSLVGFIWLSSYSLEQTQHGYDRSEIEQASQLVEEEVQPVELIPIPPANVIQQKLDVTRFIRAESAGNPHARNPHSSASGILQFTDHTWALAVAKWGKALGIRLKDKNDPKAQIALGKMLVKHNARIIADNIGREPTPSESYAAWFFGAGDVLKLIDAAEITPEIQAIRLYPKKLVAGNRGLFFDGRRPRTVTQLLQLFKEKIA